MSPYVVLITFPIVFVGELPDKTMFASLVMATKGRPLNVWIGAALAFLCHVAIAVTIGVALFHFLPRTVVDSLCAAAFLAGGIYAWIASRSDDKEEVEKVPSARGVMISAFVVIFIAEWGDLTQILIANLAAKYGEPFAVALGGLAALWVVAAIAVTGGRTLIRFLSVERVRQVTALVCVGMAGYAALSAAT